MIEIIITISLFDNINLTNKILLYYCININDFFLDKTMNKF